jgi:hypothetical protein
LYVTKKYGQPHVEVLIRETEWIPCWLFLVCF